MPFGRHNYDAYTSGSGAVVARLIVMRITCTSTHVYKTVQVHTVQQLKLLPWPRQQKKTMFC